MTLREGDLIDAKSIEECCEKVFGCTAKCFDGNVINYVIKSLFVPKTLKENYGSTEYAAWFVSHSGMLCFWEQEGKVLKVKFAGIPNDDQLSIQKKRLVFEKATLGSQILGYRFEGVFVYDCDLVDEKDVKIGNVFKKISSVFPENGKKIEIPEVSEEKPKVPFTPKANHILKAGDVFSYTIKDCCQQAFQCKSKLRKCYFIPDSIEQKYGKEYTAWFVYMDGRINNNNGRVFRNIINSEKKYNSGRIFRRILSNESNRFRIGRGI